MENKRKIKTKILILLIAVVVLMIPFLSIYAFPTYAENETEYTSVLEDLHHDESFDINKFPVIENDYSLKVIQIAESSNNELFVYVYQPSGNEIDLRATSINISISEDLDYIHYDLEYLNSYSTLYKYKVIDFTVSSEEERYYNVSSIFREWNNDYDGVSDSELEKAFEVGQVVIATGFGDNATYEYSTQEVVSISDKKALNVYSFDNPFFGWMTPGENGYCSHVVLFSTDLPIDKVIEATVLAEYMYSTHTYNTHGAGYFPEDEVGEPYSTYKTLRYDDIGSVSENGNTYVFNRIMTPTQYLTALGDSAENFEDEFIGYDWVLCISEAEDFFSYTYQGVLYGYSQIGGTLLQDATILELTFDMGGKTYTLGVVDNVSSAGAVGSGNTWWNDIIDWFNSLSLIFQILVGIAIGACVLIVLYFIFKLLQLAFESIKKLFGGG